MDCFERLALNSPEIDVGRTPCGQPGCNGVTSDFASVTLLNYMLLGITLTPFTVVLGLSIFYFGVMQEGRVVLNPQGKLAVVAKLLSRIWVCLPRISRKTAASMYRRLKARYVALSSSCLTSPPHIYK